MSKLRSAASVAGVVLATAVIAGAVEGQADQAVLAQQLLGQDRAQRDRALTAIESIDAENRSSELRTALITLLERLNAVKAEARSRGVAVETLENPETIWYVAHLVAQLQDPRAIPALSKFPSVEAARALAAFGERAVPELVGVVASPTSHYTQVENGLLALRFIVEASAARPLSDGALRQIREAAEQRLTGEQYFTPLWSAIDLAIALDDPQLRQIVEALASDRGEVIARGITAAHLIDRTQKRAADRLAGLPPLPRIRH